MRDIVLNHIHERCLAILLDGGCWNQRHPLQRIHQQPRVDKLVGEERIIFVVEDGSRFDCSRRGVNLVVERQQLPAGNLGLRSAIKGIDGELGLLAQLSCNWAETVFRYGENYGDGLNCVMTARVAAPADCTTLPGSTSRKPTRPAMGAVIWQ